MRLLRMGRYKYMLSGVVIFAFVYGVFYFAVGRGKNLFIDEFQSDLNWERQCTRNDGAGTPVIPAVGHQFKNVGTSSEDGMLHLYTGDAAHVGGGEWFKSVDILVNEKTRVEWEWAACRCEGYQFWIQVGFNNHRSIYYVASDSKPPGLYRGEQFIPYRGMKYRDREGRSRFFPSVMLLVGMPGDAWRIMRRSISEDYINSYGGLPDDFRITDITIGMMDDSSTNVNEMGVEYFRIYSSRYQSG